jgi:hypothetical protein
MVVELHRHELFFSFPFVLPPPPMLHRYRDFSRLISSRLVSSHLVSPLLSHSSSSHNVSSPHHARCSPFFTRLSIH